MKQKFKNMSDTNLLLTITIVVFFAMYIGAIIFQGAGFLKPQTFFNMLIANSALIITSCGMSLVMITGGIDISVGGVVALVSMSCAVLLDYKGGNVLEALLLAIGIGLAFGLVQGYLVAYLNIQPFIVTLAGMFFARGMTTIVHTNPFPYYNSGTGRCQQAWRLRSGLCQYRSDRGTCHCYYIIHSSEMDKIRPSFLRGRR